MNSKNGLACVKMTPSHCNGNCSMSRHSPLLGRLGRMKNSDLTYKIQSSLFKTSHTLNDHDSEIIGYPI